MYVSIRRIVSCGHLVDEEAASLPLPACIPFLFPLLFWRCLDEL